jgi:hypothetical protein
MKRQTSRIGGLAILSLVISLVGNHVSEAAGQKSWSVNLGEYGVRKYGGPAVRLAATHNVVAVAFGNPTSLPAPNQPDNRWSSPWEVTLLLFDANNGKLTKKSGPWSSDFSFELYPTAQGNLVLLLRHFHVPDQSPGETLHLLSSSGRELNQLDLMPSIRRSTPDWNRFLVSSSGRTMLLEQSREDGIHYRMLETDTLETKFEWAREAGSDSPSIIALSDKELLGMRAKQTQKEPRQADDERDLYVRSFDGPWRPLSASLDVSHRGWEPGVNPNQLAFLTDSVLVGVNAKRKQSEPPLTVVQSDGTILSLPVIPKLPDRTSLSGPVAASAGGRYFAVGFVHQPWISHVMLDVMQMDMTFSGDDSLYLVWEASRPEPVARVPAGNDMPRALSFSLDDPPGLAFINGSTLKVVRIQPKANSPKVQ